jgi:DNA-binding CsgD family transcriptional regulator
MSMNWGQNRRYDPYEALSFLEDLLIECDAGAGGTVLVCGGPASGKTHLRHELVARARELDIVTLTAVGAEDERDVEGGVLDQLLAGVDLPARESERARRFGPAEAEDRIAFLASAVHRLARDHAVLVAVDDLQHVDETSARLLLGLQRRADSAALLLVLTGADAWFSGGDRSFVAQPHRNVQLTPLSVGNIAKLVTTKDANGLPEHIHRLSAGNPLLVGALLDAHRDRVDAGLAYSDAVQRLLGRYTSPLREVATAIAVLDTDVTAEVVATVAGVATADVEASADELANTGLVDGVRFRQPPAAAAVVGGLRGAEKVRLHARAAEVKHARGLAAADVARHLVAAGETDAEWAMPVLVEAAEQVMLHDDVEFATRCLRLAETAATARWEKQTISQLLARISFRVNPAVAAPALRSLADNDSLDQLELVALARHALWFGERERFETVVAALGRDDEPLDPRTAAELVLAAHWHHGACPPMPEIDDPWLHTARTLAGVWRTGGNETLSVCAERILQNCGLSDTSLEALATAVLALDHDNKADRAQGWCTSLREEAESRGAVTWQAMLDAVGASLLLRRGDVAGAVEVAGSALALLDGPNWGVAVCYPLTTLLAAHTSAGAFKAAAAVLRHPLPEAATSTIGGLRYLRAVGHFHLATNRDLAAVSNFQQCRRILAEQDVDLPAAVPWRTDLAEANLRLGNVRLAVDLAKQQLACAAPTDGNSCGQALRVLAFATDAVHRPGMLGQAAEAFKSVGDRLELAKTARAQNQLGQRAERSAGLVKPVAVPRPTTRPAVTRPPRPPAPPAEGAPTQVVAVLSEAELRVAEHAALGRTNRQIAATLYITVSTVEQHLTRIYRKLGVPGRSALAGELAGDEEGTVRNGPTDRTSPTAGSVADGCRPDVGVHSGTEEDESDGERGLRRGAA